MTVQDLREYLGHYPDHAVIVFEPRELTAMGLPRWTDAVVQEEYDMDDEPTGRVLIRMSDLTED